MFLQRNQYHKLPCVGCCKKMLWRPSSLERRRWNSLKTTWAPLLAGHSLLKRWVWIPRLHYQSYTPAKLIWRFHVPFCAAAMQQHNKCIHLTWCHFFPLSMISSFCIEEYKYTAKSIRPWTLSDLTKVIYIWIQGEGPLIFSIVMMLIYLDIACQLIF